MPFWVLVSWFLMRMIFLFLGCALLAGGLYRWEGRMVDGPPTALLLVLGVLCFFFGSRHVGALIRYLRLK